MRLLPRFTSTIRLTSSTHARSVCLPELAVQVLLPVGPKLAVTVTDWPAPSDVVVLSEQVTSEPSTWKATPMMTPLGVATEPWFFTVAENVTGAPADGLVGDILMLMTVKSMPTFRGTKSLLLVSSLSAIRL